MDNEDLSDCAEVQADLSLYWMHMPESMFSYITAYLTLNMIIGPFQAKIYLQACGKFVASHDPAHVQNRIRAFALRCTL